ncbi:hypothetical protein DFJ73DRAFT_778170 [Zopfochytrium polystomum]|nr:hypothetical protein DFJ73DRAFT_778170 [Zopfochytrium polystomum]
MAVAANYADLTAVSSSSNERSRGRGRHTLRSSYHSQLPGSPTSIMATAALSLTIALLLALPLLPQLPQPLLQPAAASPVKMFKQAANAAGAGIVGRHQSPNLTPASKEVSLQCSSTHTVVAGDTCVSILSNQTDVRLSVKDLIALNRQFDPAFSCAPLAPGRIVCLQLATDPDAAAGAPVASGDPSASTDAPASSSPASASTHSSSSSSLTSSTASSTSSLSSSSSSPSSSSSSPTAEPTPTATTTDPPAEATPTPDPTPPASDPSSDDSPCKSCGIKYDNSIDYVTLHNLYRALYNRAPLALDAGLVSDASRKVNGRDCDPLTFDHDLVELAALGEGESIGTDANSDRDVEYGLPLGFFVNDFKSEDEKFLWHGYFADPESYTADVGHFGQMISARFSRVGCAGYNCQSGDGMYRKFVSCRYK